MADIFTILKTNYNTFTKSEKRLADYVLKKRESIVSMSITELAQESKVAESSVSRFCKRLDLKGYQEFKIAIAQSTHGDEKDSTRELGIEILFHDELEVMASKVKNTNISALDETYNLINYDELERAVDAMIASSRVRFFGVGSSLITAMEGQNKFLRIMNKSEVAFDSHLQAMAASMMNDQEVAIVISYSGQTKDAIEVAKIAKKAGALVVAITRFNKSPLTAYSDIILLCGANEGPLQGGSLSAKISQLYLLDIMYFEYFKKTYEESKRNKEITARSVLDKLI